MNFLAHIFLSGENPRIRIGNFMGDFVKGSDYKNFHKDLQIGILLHRSIDSYTDAHPVFRMSKRIISETYHHFSGIIIDMFYDHFLAKNWNNYSETTLEVFSQAFYKDLEQHRKELNDNTKNIIPHLIRGNWLVSYKNTESLGKILGQMDQRFPYPSNMKDSIDHLNNHYSTFEDHFTAFFQDIMEFSEKERQKLFLDFY